MQTILILGGGKSSSYLIEYLAASCANQTRNLILADLDLNQAKAKLKDLPGTSARSLDIQNEQERKNLIQEADLVVSMLPAFMHPIVAKDCLELGKHFFSASYESADMKVMKTEIESKGLFFLNECGLDPGIDHMSAMKIIDEARSKGEEILSFKSYCGGLLAPMSEDNPWKYKFTWNPRNVILAGQGTAVYQEKGDLKIVPYHQVFKRIEPVSFYGIGDFEGYPNRDSLSYKKVYGLDSISTILRGTLRRSGFSKAWDVFVQLGMTDDTINMELPENSSLRQFLNSFLPYHESLSIEEKLANFIPDLDFPTFEKIQWLGFFGTRKLPKASGTPASILQSILEEDWALGSNDKDMIVMKHFFEIKGVNQTKNISSSLVCFGENSIHTAMAKTVGLPLAIAVDLFLKKEIDLKGLHVPVIPEIYAPILKKLEEQGIHFKEKEEPSGH